MQTQLLSHTKLQAPAPWLLSSSYTGFLSALPLLPHYLTPNIHLLTKLYSSSTNIKPSRPHLTYKGNLSLRKSETHLTKRSLPTRDCSGEWELKLDLQPTWQGMHGYCEMKFGLVWFYLVLFSLEPLNLSSGLYAVIPQEEQIQIRRCFYQGASVAPLGTSHLQDTGSGTRAQGTERAGPSRHRLAAFRAKSWAADSSSVASLLFCENGGTNEGNSFPFTP